MDTVCKLWPVAIVAQMVAKCAFSGDYLFSSFKMRILCGTFLMLPIGEWGTGNGEVSILELELRTQTSPQNENLMRNILKASHAS